jgi:glycosyltransferase A (GT-A) superfamily protein (DUF2064 family)
LGDNVNARLVLSAGGPRFGFWVRMFEPGTGIHTRDAVLVFARGAETDRRLRGLSRAAGTLLRGSALAAAATGAAADVHLFTPGAAPVRGEGGYVVHGQRGRTFGQRLSNAVASLAGLGYQRIVIVGGDCPDLSAADVRDALAGLAGHDAVLGPDHRGGCWLIAIHARDAARLRGVRWRRGTDFAELLARFADRAVATLSLKIDIDGPADVSLLARTAPRWRWLADVPSHTTRAASATPWAAALAHVRLSAQLPPPLAA